MTQNLNLDDIQGNVIRAYGKFGYPFARYFFLNISNPWVGRRFLDLALPKLTTARRWPENETGSRSGPPVTMNIGLTFTGLLRLGVPNRALRAMPDDFITGMRDRAFVLGDRPSGADDAYLDGKSYPAWMEGWDPIWQENRSRPGSEDVHIWLSMNAQAHPGTKTPVSELDLQTDWLRDICAQVSTESEADRPGCQPGSIRIIARNGRNGDQEYQSASAVFTNVGTEEQPVYFPTPFEHFGMTDGIGDPVFEGQYAPSEEKAKVKGRGKWMDPERQWEPLATGEFLLGHPDESQELPPAARPPELTSNGTFMVYRKLHQNVASYRDYWAAEAVKFASTTGVAPEHAETVLKSKAFGRWPDGVPLAKAPTWDAWQAVRAEFDMDNSDPVDALLASRNYLRSEHASDFKYATDIRGHDCPGASHLRRVNTRDYLDPENDLNPKTAPETNKNATTSLNKRRRIMRRGLPYGATELGEGDDDTEQGVAMMILCASIFRQFEFVQQQWIQYGLDFNAGNNTCPILGDHSVHKRFTVPADPARGETPHVCDGLKTFVEPRGGEYFFIPSMTALRLMANGMVDPT